MRILLIERLNWFSLLLALQILLVFSPASNANAQTAVIDSSTMYQTIDGFGASTGWIEGNANLNSSQAAAYFSSSTGIGLSWIRIQDCGSVSFCPGGYGTTNTPDLQTLKYAVANGAKVLISLDPAAGDSSQWSAQSTYAVNKLNYLAGQGVPVSEVSPINEPSNANSFTNSDIDGLVKVMGPALSAAGYGSVGITIPEWESQFSTDFYSACLGDSTCASYVNIGSEHGYATWPFASGGGQFTPAPGIFGSRHIWQTEVNDSISKTYTCNGNQLAPYDPSIADGIAWAENIWDFLTGQNGSMWMYWNLESGYSPSCNDGLADNAFNPAKRFYTLGNYSKFVRPGQVRIAATGNPQTNVYVAAFKDTTTGAFEIVAINANSNSVSQSYDLSGLSANSVTPYVTDANNNLQSQAAVAVTGGTFTATLNASSVTTFVSSGGGPGAPTNLVGSVIQ